MATTVRTGSARSGNRSRPSSALDIVPKTRSPGPLYHPRYEFVTKSIRQASLKGRVRSPPRAWD